MTDDTTSTSISTNASDDPIAERTIHDRLIAEAGPVNRASVLTALAAIGLTQVIVSFDGYGDSGQIENVEATCEDTLVELPEIEVAWLKVVWETSALEQAGIPLTEAIEEIVYDCLGQTHPGWPDNEGSFGDVTFDVAKRTITLDYNERFTGTEHFQHVF